MKNKVWRVTLKYGYYGITFDFDDSDAACKFIIISTKTFNKSESYDCKDLSAALSYVESDEQGEN